jgi:tetratricopeptide (TPR) repeat protein
VLEREGENLRLAWQYWLGEGDLEQLNKLVDSLWFLYDKRGWYRSSVELADGLLKILESTPPSPERTAQELTLKAGIARTLLALHGFTEEVEEAYARAIEVVGDDRELPQIFPVLRGLASLLTYRAEFDKAERVGQEMLRMAEMQQDPIMRLDADFVVGSIVVVNQDLHRGLWHFDNAIAGFQSHGHKVSPFHFGPNRGVSSLAVSAFAQWLLGFPDQALDRGNRAVQLAYELAHPLSMAYALYHTGFLHLWRREPERVRDRALETLDVAGDHNLPIWLALGRFLLGAAKPGLGRSDEGLADIARAAAEYEGLTTPPVFWPLLLYVRADACARAGRLDEGLRWIDEVIEIMGPRNTMSPEFYLTKADLLLAGEEAHRADAEEWFRRAYRHAEEFDARMSQLRAALGLYRADPTRRDAESGYDLLRAIFPTFREGLDTPDLIEAATVLRES